MQFYGTCVESNNTLRGSIVTLLNKFNHSVLGNVMLLQVGYKQNEKISYWMRDRPVYGRNPANGKSSKEKATNLSLLRSFI